MLVVTETSRYLAWSCWGLGREIDPEGRKRHSGDQERTPADNTETEFEYQMDLED